MQGHIKTKKLEDKWGLGNLFVCFKSFYLTRQCKAFPCINHNAKSVCLDVVPYDACKRAAEIIPIDFLH